MKCFLGCPECKEPAHELCGRCSAERLGGCGDGRGYPECMVGVAAPPTNVGDPVEFNGAAIQSKLDAHDMYARSAVRYLIDWLRDDPEPLLAMARGRHAEGHYRHKDSLMFEYSQNELAAEAAQELADAICYVALKIQRAT